ncbi:MAG TPA: DNA repair protein RecN [Aliidongia sp.]|nr:DNA repair protein RecN [Aliidongia sp.]
MLLSLTIRDVVLIDRLDLAFSPHLSVLTGETGAGKSILLDALGLALGARAESGLVRHGADQAIVTAAFDIAGNETVRAFLADQGMEAEDTLLLRRIVGADGRSRGFVNDQPASIGLMKQLGDGLVEIQGQFEQRGLLDPAGHRTLLDAFAAEPAAVAAVARHWQTWRDARWAREAAEGEIAKAKADEEWLRHAVTELDRLKPEPGEESLLAERRTLLMHRAQIAEAMAAAWHELDGDRGAEHALNNAARLLEKVRDKSGGRLEGVIAALERAIVETTEALALLDTVRRDEEADDTRLETVEERLFELRTVARKHGVPVDGLAALLSTLVARLGALEDGGTALKRLIAAEQQARADYRAAADRLTALRRKTAQRLDRAVQAELPPLKLDRARFATLLQPLAEADWGPDGAERVAFEVATNPGAAPGPLAKIASGGELSRFLLALKLVLARVSRVPTIVFDEVDSGVGGAVAAAIGERLQRLGEELQVLVVTHSPQVAARGAQHWRVAKLQQAATTVTRVEPLDPRERSEEIARMLSGASITAEARAAADSLLAASLHPAPG